MSAKVTMALDLASPARAAPDRSSSRKDRSGAPMGAWYAIAFTREIEKAGQLRRRIHGTPVAVSLSDRGELSATGGGIPWQARRHLGLVWVCARPDLTPNPGFVEDDGFDSRHIIARTQCIVRTDFDQAVLGLVDPAHVPMIHDVWWWRTAKKRRHKTKLYAPSDFGFTATAQDRFVSAPPYKIIGGNVEISIEFRLPCTRVERTVGDRGRILNLTTVTPIGARGVVLRNVLYSDLPALKLLSPLISSLSKVFLGQDGTILKQFHPTIVGNNPRLFVGDPDRPSLFYYKAKEALLRAQDAGGEFVNPVKPTELRWMT